MKYIIGLILSALLILSFTALQGQESSAETEQVILNHIQHRPLEIDAIKKMGTEALPHLVTLYQKSTDDLQKARIAWTFYKLGHKSNAAYEVMYKDINTKHQDLRLQVTWALGRVSADEKIIPKLVDIMRNDPNPLFRDKAACALASDQIHIDDEHRIDLIADIIDSLSDTKLQVRKIALQALKIHTGQTKGFKPDASIIERNIAIEEWEKWLIEYRSSF